MAKPTWITLSKASGSNDDTVTVTAAANPSDSRSGTLTITGGSLTKTVSIEQAAPGKLTLTLEYGGDGTGKASIGTSATAGVMTTSVYPGTEVTLTAGSPSTGSKFAGWYIGGVQKSTSLTYKVTVDANTEVEARFNLKTYTITYAKGANIKTISKVSETVKHGANAVGCTATVNNDTAQYSYAFDGWYDGATKASTSATFAPTNVTASKTYTAKATSTVNQYTITVTSEDTSMGTVTGGGTYDYGESVQIRATAKTDHRFVQWSDGNTTNPRTITVSGNATYTAEFAKVNRLEVSPTSLSFEATGGTKQITITSNVSWTIS